MKKPNVVLHKALLAGTLGCCVLFSGCSAIFPVEESPITPPLVKQTEVNYTTVEVKRGDIVDSVSGTVSVTTPELYNLAFEKRSGTIKELYFGIGSVVKKGEVLARLDVTETQRQIEFAKLEVATANVQIKDILNRQVDTRDVDIKIAFLKIEQLKEDFEKEKNRIGSTVLTADEKLRLEMMELDIEKAQVEYEKLLENSNVPNPDLEIAQFSLKQAEERLSMLQEELNNCTLVAPCDGFITSARENLAVGNSVNANEAIGALVDNSKLQLLIAQNEKLAKMDVSKLPKAKILIQADNKKPYSAKLVSNIDPKTKNPNPGNPYALVFDTLPPGVNYANGFYSVNTALKDKNGDPAAEYLAYGSNAFTYSVDLETKSNVLYIPQNSVRVIADGQGSSATVSVLENGVKVDRTVTLGFKNAIFVEITEGLDEGELVIIR